MAALSITAAQVLGTSGDPVADGLAGEAITQGQAVYYRESDGKWLKAVDSSAAGAGAAGYGIALNAAGADGQPIRVALPGHRVTLGAGAAPVAGIVYYIGDTAGGLFPVADLGSGDKVTPIALGIGSNKVKILAGAYDPGAALA